MMLPRENGSLKFKNANSLAYLKLGIMHYLNWKLQNWKKTLPRKKKKSVCADHKQIHRLKLYQ